MPQHQKDAEAEDGGTNQSEDEDEGTPTSPPTDDTTARVNEIDSSPQPFQDTNRPSSNKLANIRRDQQFDARMSKTPNAKNEPLLDPNLKEFFLSNPCPHREFMSLGLINEEGEIICTLDKFNQYQTHLDRIKRCLLEYELKKLVLERQTFIV